MNRIEEILSDVYDRLGWTNIWLFLIFLNTCGGKK